MKNLKTHTLHVSRTLTSISFSTPGRAPMSPPRNLRLKSRSGCADYVHNQYFCQQVRKNEYTSIAKDNISQ